MENNAHRRRKMETFAEYILGEKEISAKLEITYYLAKKRNIFFGEVSTEYMLWN